jgi:hypothetical protein
MPTGSDPLSVLTPRERARLAGILSRLSSSFESERAAAGLLASAFITKHGLAWSDLTLALQTRSMPAQPAAPTDPRRERRNSLGRWWQGYCRRRPAAPGHTLSRLA